MKTSLFYLAVFAGMGLVNLSPLQAGDISLDFKQSAIREEKGSQLASGTFSVKGNDLSIKVETSASSEFDFYRLVIPASGQVDVGAKFVMEADVTLASENFLDIVLQTDGGTQIFHAIKESVSGRIEIPIRDFSVSGEGAFPYNIVEIRLMVSGDKSAETGEDTIVIKKLEILE
ncbi:hypothetical protein TSACC_21010 [Terrimicrobium sacchariphilum]|uniref:Uncharacterized protein n=1 Tax=Terrimicrobium sacchariphilum TaxID=690879 RepID=A0A146G4V3_TERSA|nr:hypothetical protein [Terrimicrobium sacchariphilum]GAT32611.1 hypothetical protein TSACC_21010 [Terrimicrobium sacchariphilum]